MRVLYFAWLRETVGLAEEMLAPGAATPRALVEILRARSAGHDAAFADLTRLRCAVDGAICPLDAPLGEAREIAFFPPFTGG
ncbi:MoaD/ThiS family protein [Acidocella sp.]|uniref:MoaD/ThiS family protein n=1 Tax=Acidocella sp. TaxID=50710 RepID=UPI002634DBBC|nr:MoaD/ThiS family protein [Acidocella sp.]